jgi:N-acetylglucosamine-6-phosphate deacetylase
MQVEADGADARIARVSCEDPSDRSRRCPWITPGLFDLQVNGIAGTNFADPDVSAETLAAADGRIRARGISRYCPTVITRDRAATVSILSRLGSAMRAGAMPGAWGIHLEGPWISAEDGYRGVHQGRLVRLPDRDEFRELERAAGGAIRIVTLAPELPGAEELIREIAGAGITVSLGHTRASTAEVEAAVRAGARMSTHLFNGCAQLVDRHSNTIYAQLACDGLYACFIADGHHVPGPALRVGLRAKGPGRSILVSDVAHLSGLPDGEYGMEANRVVVRDGGIWVKGEPLLSGAARTLDEDVALLAAEPWCGIERALLMASAVPAEATRCRAWAELAPGRTGPLALFEWDGRGLRLAERAGF